MSLSPLEKATSGALASALANALIYPLDLSKTLIQTLVKDRSSATCSETPKLLKYKNTIDVLIKIYRKRGLIGWYHGLWTLLLGTITQNFAYFYWYAIVKRLYARMYRRSTVTKPSTAAELLLGATAAAISQLFTTPIGVLATQEQTDPKLRSMMQLLHRAIAKGDICLLWKGLRVSLILTVNPSITYGLGERLRMALYGDKVRLRPQESFLLGVLAKLLATIATQPLIVSKALLQKQSEKESDMADTLEKDVDDAGMREAATDETKGPDEVEPAFDSFSEALSYLWETERFAGLYKGIAPQLAKGVLVQGLLFTFRDQIDMAMVRGFRKLNH